MRVVVTGKNGQLVQSLLSRIPSKNIEVIAIGRPELDLLRPSNIFPILSLSRPDIIVSAAGYTAVDQAEEDVETAFAINAVGAEAVATAAARLRVPLIHLSTDYVFDGKKKGLYFETDIPGPLSVYGKSKLEGEKRVAAATSNYAILRTAWVYSPYGTNFLKTMLRIAETRSLVHVVGDQSGCPTSALDISEAIFKISDRLLNDASPQLNGIFHVSGVGETTWAEFAKEIFYQSSKLGGPTAEVVPISSEEYPTLAFRPANSGLSGKKLFDTYRLTLPEWRYSVDAALRLLLKH